MQVKKNFRKNLKHTVEKYQFLYKKYSLYFCAVVSVAFVVLSYFVISRTESLLIISHNNFVENGGPITILNLKTSEIHKPGIKAMECDAIAKNQYNLKQLKVYCLHEAMTEMFWNINLEDYSVEHTFPFITSYDTDSKKINIPVHARFLIDEDGVEYYSSGGEILVDGDADISDAAVVVVQNGIASRVDISDQKQPYFIFRMVLDAVEHKLWVMSMGNQKTVLIDRVDLQEKKVDFSTTIESFAGFDMAINDADIVISTYQTAEKNDVFVFDKFTGARKKAFPLPVVEAGALNALSILRRGDSVYVSSTGGMFTLNPLTYEIKEFFANNPGQYFTFMVNGDKEIYAISSFNTVVAIPDRDMRTQKLILDATGQGLTSLYFINK